MPTNFTDPAELLAVVDENDNEIGSERRDVIHRDNLLHRAIHLFVFRPTGELLLQQRSALKDRYPLHWECVGGHLAPGETYDACAIREAAEELGINITQAEKICKLPATTATDYEFITIYRATTSDNPTPNPDEIIMTQWLHPDQWQKEIQASTRQFSPTLLYSISQSKILG